MNSRDTAVGTAMTVASAVGFGLMGIFAKLAYEQGMTVGTLLAYRFGIAAVLFWLWIAATRPVYRLTWRERGILWLMGIGGYAVMATLLFTSFSYMSASLAEMMFYSYPTLVCLLMRVVDKEPITARKAIALVTGFAGLILVLQGPAQSIHTVGVLLALGSALVYSFFIVYSNRLMKQVSPLVSSAHISVSAAGTLVLVALSQGTLAPVTGFVSWGAVLGVGVLSTFIAILTFFEGVKRIGSTRASIISLLEPIVTIVSSAILFHERLRPLQWTGIVIVLASLVAMELRSRSGTAEAARVPKRELRSGA
ncbi:DMT family transporter [Paenibacillus chartarius]|uniref:DMT family transporter n=1 Tax=Paenibacillus chartarius TaxID=747481 RepID=A0ABV6DV19_9BACL